MDLDLARVRAFLAVAEHGHFGRAALALSITQQGVSKRVARLEVELGVRLFERPGPTVGLTDAGRRFLGPARSALAAGTAAVEAVREAGAPLRLDVWGHLFAPLRTVREVLDAHPGPAAEVGPGRDLPGVLAALARGETDAGFGRRHPCGDGASAGGEGVAAHRLVRLEPVDAVLAAGHPLAREAALRPERLAGSRLLLPAAPARLDFLRHFAERFGTATVPGEVNLGLEHLLERVRSTPDGFTLLPAELPLAPGTGLAVVPLVDPTPLYAWSLVWHRERPHPAVPGLLRTFAELGRRRRWLEYRPDRDWLPAADARELG